MRAIKLAEIFNSFQGEYPFIGRYATFLRFWKCNLHCTFSDGSECDTMYNPHIIKFIEVEYDQIKEMVSKTNFITFTGGEPLLFTEDIVDTTLSLLDDNIYIDRILIESNGVYINRFYNILDKVVQYFKTKAHERFNLVWSPKFLDDKIISTMFSNLYEYFDPQYMYIKIVTSPEWENIIDSFISRAIELYGLRIKSKISLMFMTNNDRSINEKSIKSALKLAEKYSVNITSRLHIQLNIP